MNFLRQGFRKLSSDRQTDRQDRNYIPRRFAGGQWHMNVSVSATPMNCSNQRQQLWQRYSSPLYVVVTTRSSATVKSTARPSCLVCVLHDIYRETNNRSTAIQPLVRKWPWNLPNSENNGQYNVQGRSRSPILVSIESSYIYGYSD